jgi:hypothetical protein
MTSGDQPRPAPFVGPRAYKIGEKLFGRDRETLELLDLLIAERIVLLYSPSGAGKTSLVQAALVPALKREAFTVPAVARVTFERATGIPEPAINRYIFALLLSLEEGQPKEKQLPSATLARMTLPDYLDQNWAATAQTGGLVLILDQFEEILTIDPTDTSTKREFFAQLGAALHSRYRWALFSMREEHVAGLDPYKSLIPTRLASTFRLELLSEQQARQTMHQASAEAGVVFANSAAQRLADDLRRVRIQRPGGLLEEQLGPTVEPTQLQVVCLRLWSKLGADKRSVEESDVEALGSADTALADYYAETVTRLGARERLVRDWIEDELITPQGLRNQILKEHALQGQRVDAQAISLLDERHLVREERRRGISWLELTHDRLVQPVRSNNAIWREAHLTSFQRQAALWDKESKPSRLELGGEALAEAEAWAEAHSKELTPAEQAFLKICVQSHQRERQQKRTTRTIRLLVVLAVLSALPFAATLYSGWRQAQPWAHLTNLASGGVTELKGDTFSIGRTAGPIRNKLNLSPNTVSRLQLFISRDRHAQDARSLNGTTINARFLQYGTESELKDHDLIAIAGMALFRFSVAEPSFVPFIPARAPEPSPAAEGAWAMLIDGASRTVLPLIEGSYFISKGKNDNISIESSKNTESLLRIIRTDKEVELETLETSDDHRLFAMFKHEDRTYFAVQIPSGKRVSEFLTKNTGEEISGTEYTSKMSFCFGPSSQGRPMTLHGVATKFVIIDSDEQPSCTLGPFQIVRF